jgi:lysophospholipase L1-like esterase
MPLLNRIALWSCLPVAAWQGMSLRKTALRLPPPPGDCHGICGQTPQNRFNKPLRLLALGDSIIAGIGAAHQQQALPAQLALSLARLGGQAVSWKAVGRSGATSQDLLDMLQQLQEPAPDLVLVSIGVNDVTALTPVQRWQSNIQQLCQRMGSRWPAALVVFAGLPPMEKFPLPPQPLRFCLGLRAAELDRVAARLVDSQAAMLHIPTLIDPAEHDFCADGFHPSERAYAAWGDEMAELISSRYRNIAGRPAA